MRISIENRRLSVADDIELTASQKVVFSHWEEGFDAQGRGVPITGHTHIGQWAHKMRRVWQEGWNAGAAVDRFKANFLAPLFAS